jgi:hypothetical protein
VAKTFAGVVAPVLEPRLAPDETLRGVIAATYQKTFSGAMWAIGITDRRLVFQALDRKFNPSGPLQSASQRDHLAAAALDGAGDGWVSIPAAVGDLHSLILRITLDDGQNVKLTMTRGGMKLLGGEAQREGVVAMAELLAAAHGDPAEEYAMGHGLDALLAEPDDDPAG